MDIIENLRHIMEQNTQHYKSDFKHDCELILAAAADPEPEHKNLLWLSRTCGTECFYERDAYIKETYAHHAWVYHAGTSESCVAYGGPRADQK